MYMNGEKIKKLLEKHFGAPADTLSRGMGRAGGYIYYYALPGVEKIDALRDHLEKYLAGEGGGSLPELKQSLGEKTEEGTRYPLCATYSEDRNGRWSVTFRKLESVRYHKSRGERVSASFEPGKSVFAALYEVKKGSRYYHGLTDDDGEKYSFEEEVTESNEDLYFGLWSKTYERRDGTKQKQGFSYWINRLTYKEPRFRAFACDMLLEGADKFPILKDVAKTLSATGLFLPEMSFGELSRYPDAESLIKRFSETFPCDTGVENLSDINAGWICALLAPYVDPRDLHILLRINAKSVSDFAFVYDLYDGLTPEDLVHRYYLNKYKSMSAAVGAREYAKACIAEKTPIKLSLSMETLLKISDSLN